MRWFKRKSKQPTIIRKEELRPAADNLLLGHDDRASFTTTMSSDELAEKLLRDAHDIATTKSPGDSFTVTVEEEYPGIHHMELMMSVMFSAGRFGLRVNYQHDNSFNLTKL